MIRRVLLALFFVCTFSFTYGQTTTLSGTVKSLTGEDVDLADYKGKVVLTVNVASKCGFTKQYKGLQELYEKYQQRGLVILGFPCNQFKNQEPGSASEIAQFCSVNYGVTFPMFEKIEVNGENALPLYRFLTSESAPLEPKGPVKWNFEKFLFNRDGVPVARFRSAVKPDSQELVAAIEETLGPQIEAQP